MKQQKRKAKKSLKKLAQPILEKKEFKVEALATIFYLIIAIALGALLLPILAKTSLGLSRAVLLYLLLVSIIFSIFYFTRRNKQWKNLKKPPLWVVKERKKLKKAFVGNIILKGKQYSYMIAHDNLNGTRYFVKNNAPLS